MTRIKNDKCLGQSGSVIRFAPCIVYQLMIYIYIVSDMVRNYKRKTKSTWKLDNMQRAVDAVESGNLSLRKATVTYGVPFTTLQRHVKKGVKEPGKLGRFRSVFATEYEGEIKKHILEMQERFYGLCTTDVRRLAYQLAESHGIPHSFNKIKEMAGKDWLSGFMKRNPDLSIRLPEPTSIGRAVGFNRPQVKHFYDILESALAANTYTGSQIWNADESNITTVHKPGKVVAKKGLKQVGKITSGERGQTVTILCAMNAVGNYIPPLLIFPRKRMNDLLLKGAPPQSMLSVSDNGWITQDIFLKWMSHFIKATKPTVDNKQLLLIDGHVSHKCFQLIELARKNYIEIIILPPHTTHRLQPLDRVFYGPLKANYNKQADRWMLMNAGKRISFYDISELFGKAYIETATMSKSIKGFECTGIYPFNPDLFHDSEFSPSLVTEIIDLTPNHTNEQTCPLTTFSATTTIFIDPVSEALPTDPVLEALPTDPVSEALPTDPVSEAFSTDLVSEALPTDPVSEALSTDPVSEAIISTDHVLEDLSPRASCQNFRKLIIVKSPLPTVKCISRKRKAQRACLLTNDQGKHVWLHQIIKIHILNVALCFISNRRIVKATIHQNKPVDEKKITHHIRR